jgi:hypothetical protein
MRKARLEAARLSAKLLLQRVWSSSNSDNVREVLLDAPQLAARELQISTDHAPIILGENMIAGALDRVARKIIIATRFPLPSQRFTFAHELGHLMLHSDQIYFRDRELSGPSFDGIRPYYEIEADAFAAEFVMPRKYLEQVFLQSFGKIIDGTEPDVELAQSVSARGVSARGILGGKPKKWSPSELATTSPLNRARAIATTSNYKGKNFDALNRHFKVSATAMGIQLLQMGLIT